MSEPYFEIEQTNVFNVRMDMQTLSALERALAFYSERAILQSGDPARDLSRKLTSLLMKMQVTRITETASLPPAKEDAPEVAAPSETPQDVPDGFSAVTEEFQTADPETTIQIIKAETPEAAVAAHLNAHRVEEFRPLTEEEIQAADLVTDEENEAAVGNLGTEDMVEGSQTVTVEDDDPLEKQLDDMIGD